MLITVQQIGLAVGFSLSQMGIIISTLGGIFLLGEKNQKEFKYVVLVACLLFWWYPSRVYESCISSEI